MSTVKSKKLQVGTDATSSNNFTIYQPATPDGSLRIGVGNADSPTEVGRFDSNGYVATKNPSFRAIVTGAKTLTFTGSYIKVPFDVVDFDTVGSYNTSSYRWTPDVEGYYQFNAYVQLASSVGMHGGFARNGSIIAYGTNASNVNHYGDQNSCMFYMNGTTDYVEYFLYVNTTVNTATAGTVVWFDGHLAVPTR